MFLDRNMLHGKKRIRDRWVTKKDKRKRKVKERIHRQTRFEDNYSNRSLATALERLVGIS